MDEDRFPVRSSFLQPGIPFPFGDRDQEIDRRLFGDRRPAFSFEHLASEFETADDGQDSGIGEFHQNLHNRFNPHKFLNTENVFSHLFLFCLFCML
jgi:hypothetical protein